EIFRSNAPLVAVVAYSPQFMGFDGSHDRPSRYASSLCSLCGRHVQMGVRAHYTRPTLAQKLLNACSMLCASKARPFPAHHARNLSAIMVLSMLQPAACLRSRQCVSNSMLPDAGKDRATGSADPLRRAFRPALWPCNSRLAGAGLSFTCQPMVTLATVRPILFGVAFRVIRES